MKYKTKILLIILIFILIAAAFTSRNNMYKYSNISVKIVKMPVMMDMQVVNAFERVRNHASVEEIAELIRARPDLVRIQLANDLTLLMVAVDEDELDIARLLIKQGSDVNAIGRMKMRPIHYAARNGHVEIYDLLVRAGADPSQKSGHGISAAEMLRRRKDKGRQRCQDELIAP